MTFSLVFLLKIGKLHFSDITETRPTLLLSENCFGSKIDQADCGTVILHFEKIQFLAHMKNISYNN